jgi:hypothetical protein
VSELRDHYVTREPAAPHPSIERHADSGGDIVHIAYRGADPAETVRRELACTLFD